jgi:hypothetical protein
MPAWDDESLVRPSRRPDGTQRLLGAPQEQASALVGSVMDCTDGSRASAAGRFGTRATEASKQPVGQRRVAVEEWPPRRRRWGRS